MSENMNGGSLSLASLRRIIIPVLYVIIIILFFVKWIDIPGAFGYGANSFSLPEYMKMLRQAVSLSGGHADTSAKIAFGMVYAVILLGYILSLLACAASSILTILEKNAWLKVIGFMVSATYSFLMIIPMDTGTDDLSYQLAASMVSYTAAPYLIILLSGVGIALSFVARRAVSGSFHRS